jgi:predicted MFS family arabinose efflux permease
VPDSGASTLDAPWMLYSPARRVSLLLILLLVCTCNYIDRQVMSVLIEPIKTEFHASDAAMGALTGLAFAACYAIFGLPVARLADRGDRRAVITVAVAIWSLATAACGLAQSFIQLALARTAVGFGEAGAIPPAQSLIADYFPPAQRSGALAVFMGGATIGYMVAFSGGAWLAATHGWRSAMIALSLPGLLLALVARLGLSEPRKANPELARTARTETFQDSLRALVRKKSFVYLNLAMTLYFMVAYGALTWFAPYMSRVLHLSMVEVGPGFGVLTAISGLVGGIGGGALIGKIAARDRRLLAWGPATMFVLAAPALWIGLSTDNLPVFFVSAVIVGNAALGSTVPPMFAILHAVCGSARRATAVALIFFVANLLGLGLGPLITGRLSDIFTAAHGPVGLRYAIMAASTMCLPTAVFLWRCGVVLREDIEA